MIERQVNVGILAGVVALGRSKQIQMFDAELPEFGLEQDRKSTRLNSSHTVTSYAVFCLKKKRRCMKKGPPPSHRRSALIRYVRHSSLLSWTVTITNICSCSTRSTARQTTEQPPTVFDL